MKQLASADALISLEGHRRQQLASICPAQQPFAAKGPILEDRLNCQKPLRGIHWDYAALGLSLRHP
jgi:hypothetical protein